MTPYIINYLDDHIYQLSKIVIMTFEWGTCHQKKVEERKILEDILPPDYNYKVHFFQLVEKKPILMESIFKAKVVCNVCSKDGCDQWLQEFSNITDTCYNQSHSDNYRKGQVVVGGFRKCIHKVKKCKDPKTDQPKKDKTPGKNLDCPAKVTFQLKKSPAHHHHEDCEHYSLHITLDYRHEGHNVKCAEALRFHPVSRDTKNRIISYFDEGLSASRAHRKNKAYLKSEFKDEYLKIHSNRSYNPGYKWIFNFHADYVKEKYGTMYGEDSMRRAAEYAQKYNLKHGAELCHVTQRQNGDYFIVIHDPLTLRVHSKLPQSGDIVCVDSTGGIDRVNSRYFRFLTVSPAGGLPMGSVITSKEDEETLTEAFTKYRDTLPDEAFYRNGKMRGPTLFMSDDCAALINSLAHVWPESRTLLCHFHLLQANWRWLWSSEHEVQHCHRRHLLLLFRSVVYAKTSTKYAEARQKLLEDDVMNQYPRYIDHLDKTYFERYEAWASCVRYEEKLPTHQVNSNNYIEASFRVLKDQDLERVRRYNLADLLNFFLNNESGHFSEKLIDFGNKRWLPQTSKSRYNGKECTTNKDQVLEIEQGVTFLVESQSRPGTWFSVDMRSGDCQCLQGSSRGPCKHKAAVEKHYGISEFTMIPHTDNKIGAMYHYIAVGYHEDPTHYRGLTDTATTSEDINVFVEQHVQSSRTNVTSPNNTPHQEFDDDIGDIDLSQMSLEVDNDKEEEEKEKYWQKFMNSVELTKKMVDENWADHSFKKAFITFTNRYTKAVNSNQSTFVSNLHTFGKDKKMKNSSVITVQSTAIARRRTKEKGQGRRATLQGRRHKKPEDDFIDDDDDDEEDGEENIEYDDEEEDTDLETEDDEGDTEHDTEPDDDEDLDEVDSTHNIGFVNLPTAKSKKRKLRHNLSDAVRENRQNAR